MADSECYNLIPRNAIKEMVDPEETIAATVARDKMLFESGTMKPTTKDSLTVNRHVIWWNTKNGLPLNQRKIGLKKHERR